MFRRSAVQCRIGVGDVSLARIGEATGIGIKTTGVALSFRDGAFQTKPFPIRSILLQAGMLGVGASYTR